MALTRAQRRDALKRAVASVAANPAVKEALGSGGVAHADIAPAPRMSWTHAQQAALTAYRAIDDVRMFLDETAPDDIVALAAAAKQSAWELYDAMVKLTGVYP